MKNFLITITGPSGGGKSTLLKILQKEHGVFPVVSTTTRAPRKGEEHGKDYYFVSKEKFDKLPLLESTVYAGNHYGTSEDAIEEAFKNNEVSAIIVDHFGKQMIHQAYPERTVSIKINIDPKKSLEFLKRRGAKKGIDRFLKDVEAGIYDNHTTAMGYDFYIENDSTLEELVSKANMVIDMCKAS